MDPRTSRARLCSLTSPAPRQNYRLSGMRRTEPTSGDEKEPDFSAEITENRAIFAAALRKARAKTARRRDAVQADLARSLEADAWVAQAQWLLPAASRAARGARALVVSDWSTG